MADQVIKSERIEIRVTPQEKELMLRARIIRGDRSFTSFVFNVLKTKADEIIQADEQILKSERDKQLFFSTVLSDQEPNQALKDAARLHDSL